MNKYLDLWNKKNEYVSKLEPKLAEAKEEERVLNKEETKLNETRFNSERELQELGKYEEEKQQEYDSIVYYFFPKAIQTDSQFAISSSLKNGIVVLYNGTTAKIGLPKDKTYFLPTSYVGEDGNQITIPYLSTSNEVKLVVTGTDCDVSSNSNSFIFVMKDNEVGKKKVKLTANVYRISDNEKLACEEFYLSYERKQMPDHIVTSVDCCIYDKYRIEADDTSSLSQNTDRREITLITCTSYSNKRLIIKAVEDI